MFNIASVTSKSAITPSFNGRIATMLPGVRPTIVELLHQQQELRFVFLSIATTDGSFNTIPCPLT